MGEIIVKNPFMEVEKKNGILVAELLVKHQIDVVITKESLEKKVRITYFPMRLLSLF